MIEVNSLAGEGFDGEFYKLHFQRQGFMLVPDPRLHHLRQFSRTRHRTLGKIKTRFNLDCLIHYRHFFEEVHFILLTHYKQVLFLPFVLRLLPNVTIMATSLTQQLARIALTTFHEKVADIDLTHEQLDFFKEDEILGKYEHELGISFDNWKELYSRSQVEATLAKIVKVNYHQVFDTERGVLLRAFPSGKNNGACFWQLQSVLSHQKILLINEVSQYNWRTCQPYNIQRIQESHRQHPYELVLFTKKALASVTKQGEQLQLAESVRRINLNAESGISTTVVLSDDTLCIDLIPRLSVQPQGKIQKIMLNHESLHSMHNFINSYADYLSEHYRAQLFSQTPDYPLFHYSKLKERGIVCIGVLEELAIKRKLPLREIIQQSHPFVQFVKDYEYYLETEEISPISSNVKHAVEELVLNNNFTIKLLNQFLGAVGVAKVVGFSETGARLELLQIGRRYNLSDDKQKWTYLRATNLSSNVFLHFNLLNNELSLQRKQLELLRFPKNYLDLLLGELVQSGSIIKEKSANVLQTYRTRVQLLPSFELRVRSSSIEELLIVERWVGSKGSSYALR